MLKQCLQKPSRSKNKIKSYRPIQRLRAIQNSKLPSLQVKRPPRQLLLLSLPLNLILLLPLLRLFPLSISRSTIASPLLSILEYSQRMKTLKRNIRNGDLLATTAWTLACQKERKSWRVTKASLLRSETTEILAYPSRSNIRGERVFMPTCYPSEFW